MNFVKTTLIGGVVFLVPIIILVMILGKAHAIMTRVAAPLAEWIPLEVIGGVALANLLAGSALVALCFAAGLAARSRKAAKAIESLESNLLSSIPGYAFVKGMIASLTGTESGQQLAPVLVRFDDAWQLAFEVERGLDGKVVIYIPGAPEPWSGTVMVMNEDRVESLGNDMSIAIKNIRNLGRGTINLLDRGAEEP